MAMMSDIPMYHSIDPLSFEVGRRYHRATPAREHEFTVDRIERVGDQIRVHTFGGATATYLVGHRAWIATDLLGS